MDLRQVGLRARRRRRGRLHAGRPGRARRPAFAVAGGAARSSASSGSSCSNGPVARCASRPRAPRSSTRPATVVRDVATLRAAVEAVQGVIAGTLDIVALPTLAVDPLAAHHRPLPPRVSRSDGEGRAAGRRRHRHRARAPRRLRGCARPTSRCPATLVSHPLEVQELVVVLPPGHELASRAEGRSRSSASRVSRSSRRRWAPRPAPSSSTRSPASRSSPMSASRSTSAKRSCRSCSTARARRSSRAGSADEAEIRGASVRRLRPALTRPIGFAHRAGCALARGPRVRRPRDR